MRTALPRECVSLASTLHFLTGSQRQGVMMVFAPRLKDVFLRMASHRAYDKVDPSTLYPNWNFERPLATTDPLHELTRAMDSASPLSHLDSLLPESELYRDLKGALARYRDLAASGGWRKIDSGPALKPAMTDPRLRAVRARLRVTGDLAASDPQNPALYDEDLKRGVEGFQRRHGLAAGGVVECLDAVSEPMDETLKALASGEIG